MKYFGQADWDACHTATSPKYQLIREAGCISYNPGYEPDMFNSVLNPGAKLLAYVSMVSIPQVQTDNPFWKELIALFPASKLFCGSNGQPIVFGDPAWSLAHMKPTFGNCDKLLDFLSQHPNIRAGNGIYLDEATVDIPQWKVNQFAQKGLVITQQDQIKHAHFANRVISGLREINNWDGEDKLLVANTAKTWTHRSFDAATVEVQSPERPNATPIAEAIPYCNEQAKVGRARVKCGLWYAPANFQETMTCCGGKWL